MKYLSSGTLIVFLFSILFISCQPQQTDVAAVRKAIEEMDAASMKAWQEKDIEAAMSLYAPDAMVLPQNEKALTGKEQMESAFKMWMEGTKHFHFTTNRIDASGDLAYSTGEYTMVYQMPGMPETADTGKYTTVYKRQADGSWKIVVDIFNTSLPPPMMAMEEKPAQKTKSGGKMDKKMMDKKAMQ